MSTISRLDVSLLLQGDLIQVGELAMSQRKVFFKYSPSFLDTGLRISPFKLPLSSGILQPDTAVFDGLFGVFYDSLPDGWGRLLIDRALLSKGLPLASLHSLDRLSFVGHTGMGALCYDPAEKTDFHYMSAISLDHIAEEVQKIGSGLHVDMIEELLWLGASSGGARPKVLVGYNPVTDQMLPYAENLPDGYEHWIVKFRASTDPEDLAQIEYAYHKMALEAGIDMSACRLFEGKEGRKYFGTQRFDRIGNERLHLHSASGLMHDNFRLSSMDYGHLMDAAFRLENSVQAYSKVLRLAAFNIYAHNRDDHSKNFSFLMNAQGEWRLAPAYDLTFSSSSHGHHSTTVAGESKTPGRAQLRELARVFGVRELDGIIDEVKAAIKNWPRHAETSGLGEESMHRINQMLVKNDRPGEG